MMKKERATTTVWVVMQNLFSSKMKFDSGTGWPSFFDAYPDVLETTTDYKLVYPRTEYHCAQCGWASWTFI